MIALLQRVSSASVDVQQVCIATIATGVVVFVGVERNDDQAKAERLADRITTYRVFADAEGKMNLNVQQVGGALLLVPQFTLAADTKKGNRASFATAAEPVVAAELFDHLASQLRDRGARVACGVFGADMKVTLTNDGPVTFWLNV